MKAVILEKSGTHYTVLGTDGTFRKVRSKVNANVGEEIEIPAERHFSGLRVWAGVAAVFLLMLTALLSWNVYQTPTAVALLSVDINPSLQFTVDAQGRLLKLEAKNADAEKLVKTLELKGQPIDTVLSQLVSQAISQHYLNPEHHWIVVGLSPMTEQGAQSMPEGLSQDKMIAWVTETAAKEGLTPQVAVFKLTPEEKASAQKEGLTLGEYALWQTAQKAGVTTQPEKLKNSTARVHLLEDPQVQSQMQSDENVVESTHQLVPDASKEKANEKPSDKGSGNISPKGQQSSPAKNPNQDIKKNDDNDHESQQKGHDEGKALDKDKYNRDNEKEVRGHENVVVPVFSPLPTFLPSKDNSHESENHDREDDGKKDDKSEHDD